MLRKFLITNYNFMGIEMKNLFIYTTLIFLVFISSVYSQDHKPSSETNSSVPELNEFHEVIYPIWHTAYPVKDFELLKKMVPEVNSGAEKIYSAQLPGILRDKYPEWNKGLVKFRSSVERYNKFMNTDAETEILKSAEELHSNYEMLVRVVKPVTQEVDEFHKVLYMIYHHYWPNKNTKEFVKAVDDLEMRAKELNTCVLPKWAANKSEEFQKQSQKLYDATNSLKKLLSANANKPDIDKAVEIVHTN